MNVEAGVPEVRAVTKHISTSPPKLRLIADLIRGMPVVEAQRILDFSNKAAAERISKTLESAVANSENGQLGLSGDELYVSEIYVDEGPTLKRWLPRARGRATRIRKRTSHLTIKLAEIPEEE
jgi:large subunit ribosomal protein L22